MLRVIVVLAAIGLTIYALLDIGRTPHRETRTMPKVLWFVVALVPVLGPGLWLLIGRPRSAGGSTPTTPAIRRPRRRGPAAPDDDPEFLRRLGDEAWARKMEEQRRARGTGDGADHPDGTPRAGDREPGGEDPATPA